LAAALAGAAASAGLAFRAGLLGAVAFEPSPVLPLEATRLPRVRGGIVGLAGCGCSQQARLPAAREAWREVLGELEWEPATASEDLSSYALVVLPDGGCLGASEAKALRGYVQRGGGLLAAGLLGACRPGRSRTDERTIEQLVGAEHMEPLQTSAGAAFVALRDGSPLAAGLEALSLAPERRGRVVAVAPGPHPYWSDATLQPLDRSLPQGYQAAALSTSLGKGRVAWLGFAADEAAVRQSAPLRRLVRNAATWVAGLPVVSLAPWPSPHRTAALLRANVAGRPRNAAFVTRTLLDSATRGVFVVADDSVDELAELEPALARAGDVVLAAKADAGAAAFDPRAAARSLRARRTLGAWPIGLLVQQANLEDAARLAVRSGLELVLGEGGVARARPWVWRASRRVGPWQRAFTVVGLERLGEDDLGLSPLGLAGLTPDWVRRRLLADFELTAALGGLHVLSFHTHGLGTPDGVETLAALLGEFRRRGAWLASAAELGAWSRARAGLELTADATSAGMLRVRLRAPAVLGHAVAIDVHPPPGAHAELAPGSSPACRVVPANGGPDRLELRLDAAPNEAACEIRFEP
jgi:hypothetical protein